MCTCLQPIRLQQFLQLLLWSKYYCYLLIILLQRPSLDGKLPWLWLECCCGLWRSVWTSWEWCCWFSWLEKNVNLIIAVCSYHVILEWSYRMVFTLPHWEIWEDLVVGSLAIVEHSNPPIMLGNIWCVKYYYGDSNIINNVIVTDCILAVQCHGMHLYSLWSLHTSSLSVPLTPTHPHTHIPNHITTHMHTHTHIPIV